MTDNTLTTNGTSTVMGDWPWCLTHNHPANAWDTGTDWYCWKGFCLGEVDGCECRVASLTVSFVKIRFGDER